MWNDEGQGPWSGSLLVSSSPQPAGRHHWLLPISQTFLFPIPQNQLNSWKGKGQEEGCYHRSPRGCCTDRLL